MSAALSEVIRRTARPLTPLPTRESPRLTYIPDVRAVLFDIYGTLLVSACGELELTVPDVRGQLLADALRAMSITPPTACGAATEWLHEAIRQAHAEARRQGVDAPEVDIRTIWQAVWRRWSAAERTLPPHVDVERLALEYELRVNPVWPMPHAKECLRTLKRRGLFAGLVSNAQFFTPLLLTTLLEQPLSEAGLAVDLQFYSYEHGWAKPSTYLYELARQQLQERGISPPQVLLVGNDMRNDVWPAARLGFRTALFAGDRRSLRWRRGDPDVADCRPDLVVVNLSELLACLSPDISQRV